MLKTKDNSIEWGGEIPAGWSSSKIGRIAQTSSGATPLRSKESSFFDDATIRWVRTLDLNDGLVYDSSEKITDLALSTSACSIMPKETVCVAMYGGAGTIGKCGLLMMPCATNQAVCSIVCNPNVILPMFLLYQLLALKPYWMKYAVGTRKDPNISQDIVARMKILIPPLSKQKELIAYLDSQCSRIDALLTKTRTSIEEYKKLKQAVITQAVTKGVRGKREMKDSGVEWIGEIPREWRTTQLRHCATIKSGITLGKSYDKNATLIERPYLRVANVQGGYVDLTDLTTLQVTPDEDMKYRLHPGDVLITEGGDRNKLGRGCVWHGEIEPCLHQNHVFAVKTNESVLLPEFLEYLTASNIGRSYFDVTAIKTTNLACTSSSKVLAFTIPLPFVEEQTEIIEYIKKCSSEINKLIVKKEQLVKELEGYKKSLIYEVVTGKREV